MQDALVEYVVSDIVTVSGVLSAELDPTER
jgi:hypothetical protein